MATATPVEDIAVDIILAGGAQYSALLPADSQILCDLHVALAASHHPGLHQPPVFMQVPLDGGRAACTFMSSSLLALTTRPPVLIEPLQTVAPAGNATKDPAGPLYVRIEDFLTPGENKQLLDYALAHESNFTGSTTITKEAEHRKSRVLFAIKDSKWHDLFLARLKLHLPYIARALGKPDFHLARSEIQLTASNDGDYFRPHADSSPTDSSVAGREITFVYYLHRAPRSYSGGGLLLYSGEPGQHGYDRGASVTSVEPQNNCLVAFASNNWHEVDMVRCPSGAFAHSRFTANGWLWRTTPPGQT